MTEVVIKEIEVACGADQAFEVFVNKTAKWWPLAGHSVSAGAGEAALAVTIEPRKGGAVYETKFDGSRTDWGEVIDFDPGRRISMTWHPGTNVDSPTKVEVTFSEISAAKTLVTLVHSGWEVWAEKADDMRNGYNSGWVIVFEERFANACA